MTDYIKQLESKVKDCKNTNTIFNKRKYVLLEDAKEILSQALNIPVVVDSKRRLENWDNGYNQGYEDRDRGRDKNTNLGVY